MAYLQQISVSTKSKIQEYCNVTVNTVWIYQVRKWYTWLYDVYVVLYVDNYWF